MLATFLFCLTFVVGVWYLMFCFSLALSICVYVGMALVGVNVVSWGNRGFEWVIDGPG